MGARRGVRAPSLTSSDALLNVSCEFGASDGDEPTLGARYRAIRTWEAAKPLLEAAAAKTGDAAFIITSSVSAVNSDNPSSYGAMKAALIHFAKGVARSSAAAKVRCNVVSPGTVFFAGYGGSYVDTGRFKFSGLSRTEDGFFLKASYLFRL